MMNMVSKVAWAVACPSTELLAALLIGLTILALRRCSRIGFGLVVLSATGIGLCAILPVGTWLMRPLEERFPSGVPAGHAVDGIILLGGAIDARTSVARGTPTLNMRAGRMVAFLALARQFPQAKLVFTGGTGDLSRAGPTEAQVALGIVSALVAAPGRLILEQKSRNTRENALFSRPLARPKPGQRWLLVTSAADMSRAVGCFRAVNWPVEAVPVDYHTEPGADGWLPGLVAGLEKVDWAAHEWIGLLYYRIRGWTPSLFPGPMP